MPHRSHAVSVAVHPRSVSPGPKEGRPNSVSIRVPFPAWPLQPGWMDVEANVAAPSQWPIKDGKVKGKDEGRPTRDGEGWQGEPTVDVWVERSREVRIHATKKWERTVVDEKE
eukprot:scaffold1235_cov300-Pavlova_lutheri.AAC.4